MTSRTKTVEKATIATAKGIRIIAEVIVIQVSDTRLLLFIVYLFLLAGLLFLNLLIRIYKPIQLVNLRLDANLSRK